MILINFGHPLTRDNLSQLCEMLGHSIDRLIEVPVQFDPGRPFTEQTVALVERVGLSPAEWQSEPLLINPPALNVIVATLLAELHGRMGYFPPVVRLRPSPGSLAAHYEVAEIIDLRTLRDAARARRIPPPAR